MDRNLKRLQLVARRFGELQGLRVACAGSVFTLVFGTYVIAPPAEGSGGIWIALVAAFALFLPCERIISHYYESKLGRVLPARPPRGPWEGALMGALLVVFGLVWKVPPPAAVFPFLAAFSLRIVIRDWPYRTHHLATFAAAGAATLLVTSPGTTAARDLTMAMAFLLLGVASVPVGFLDHRLLVTVMHADRRDEATAQSETSPDRRD